MISELSRQLRDVLRGLRRSPGFAAAAIGTLALGIAASTAIFSILHSVVLAPLPYRAPARIVVLWETAPDGRLWRPAPASLRAWREHARWFESLAAFQGANFTLTEAGEPVSLQGSRVSGDFFRLLGVAPVLGRGFLPGEARRGAPPVVVLGHDLWLARFGGDPAVLGRTITLEGTARTIVGVMPPAPFPTAALTIGAVAFAPGRPDFWVPADLDHAGAPSGRSYVLGVLGRLRPGVSLEAAQTEMTALARRLAALDSTSQSTDIRLRPLDRETKGATRPALWLLFGAVLFVLAIGAANVTSLQLARAEARDREMAVRAALGAGRARIAGQILLESVVLSAAAGALGVLLAVWSLPVLVSLLPSDVPRLAQARIHPGILAFAVLISAAVGILSGFAPALSAARRGASRTLASAVRDGAGSRGARRSLRVLVLGEMAVAVLLASGAILLTRSFLGLSRIDPGFRPAGVTVAHFSLPRTRYPGWAQVARFEDALLSRVRELPGVVSASLAYNHPLEAQWIGSGEPETLPGAPALQKPPSWFRPVSEGYFGSVGAPIIAGRDFTASDDLAHPGVAIVNSAFVRAHFPGGRALGRFLESSDAVSWWGEGLPRRFEIVGVVGDVRFLGLDKSSSPAYYLSVRQFPIEDMGLVVRGAVDAGQLRKSLWSLDPALPLQGVATLTDLYGAALGPSRLNMRLMLVFGGLAVGLAMVGAYGLLSYVVALRRRELSIRIALGARSPQVVGTVLAETVRLCLGGIVLGLAASLALAPLLSHLLFGITAADPASLAGAALVLLCVTLLASGLPASRAVRIAPNEALKGE